MCIITLSYVCTKLCITYPRIYRQFLIIYNKTVLKITDIAADNNTARDHRVKSTFK